MLHEHPPGILENLEMPLFIRSQSVVEFLLSRSIGLGGETRIEVDTLALKIERKLDCLEIIGSIPDRFIDVHPGFFEDVLPLRPDRRSRPWPSSPGRS